MHPSVSVTEMKERAVEGQSKLSTHRASRRAFLLKGLVVGAGAAGSGLLANALPVFAKTAGKLTSGDAAILRFLSAIEIIETDLWQQYNELGGVNGGNPAYMAALSNLDGDMPQYISD